jgi:hypothetical protein
MLAWMIREVEPLAMNDRLGVKPIPTTFSLCTPEGLILVHL